MQSKTKPSARKLLLDSDTTKHSNFNLAALIKDSEKFTETFKGIDLSNGFAIVLGTGWSLDSAQGVRELGLTPQASIPYNELASLGGASVSGHAGVVTWATAGDRQFLFFQGRKHWFELSQNHDLTSLLAIPFFVHECNASTLFMTQGVGGIGAGYDPGTYTIVTDHIGPEDLNAFPGAGLPIFKDEFAVCNQLYSTALMDRLSAALESAKVQWNRGIYRYSPAKQFQTPAEIRRFKAEGANLVGKSGYFESLYATQLGLDFASIALILNKAAGEDTVGPDHLMHKRVGQECAVQSRLIMRALTDVVV